MSDCPHPIRYRPFALGPWYCPVCTPPKRAPRMYGILQEDGSVLSMGELAARRRALIQAGAERAAKDLLRAAWPGEEFEVVHLELGRDGWPKHSIAGVTLPRPPSFLFKPSQTDESVVG